MFIASSISAQKHTTFKICDLETVPFDFHQMTAHQALENKVGTGVEAWSGGKDKIISGSLHPFVEATHNAYAKHRGLVISPDMIWLMIAQGFAKHVDENSDSLRHYFVDFDGKKVLKVVRNGFVKGSADNDWEGVFPEFTQQIAAYTGKELLENTVLDFSTTTPIEKAAMEVTLMDGMSSYFIYAVGVTCGITDITLEGTTEDWEKIVRKTKALGQYDLSWWTDELVPVLEEFVAASKGEVNESFWQSMYQQQMVGCGSQAVSGWITKFFPYSISGENAYPRKDLSYAMEHSQFTSGMAKADFYWFTWGGGPYQMEFVAGFAGMTEDPKTKSLRPYIAWGIRDSGKVGIKEEDAKYADEINNW